MSKSTLVELEDRSGVKYTVHRIGDTDYPDFPEWHDKDFSELLALLDNFEFRSHDVLMSSYPKCGSHWVYEILSMIHYQTTEVPKKLFEDLLDTWSPEHFEEVKQIQESRLLVTTLIPSQASKNGAKVVLLVRNLKDQTVSLFHYLRILTKFLPYKGSWDDFLEIQVFGKGLIYGTWFDCIKQCDQYIKNNPGAPIHLLVYEELKENTLEGIKQLCAFLDKPDHLAETIAEKVSFKNMKSKETTGEGKYAKEKNDTCEPGTSGLMRKGIVGDWKNMFTVAQNERADKLYDELLGDSPIGQRLKKYVM